MNGTDAFCTNLFLSFCMLTFYESSVCPSVCLFQNAFFDHLQWSASISAFKIRMHQNQLQPNCLGKSSSISNLLQTLHIHWILILFQSFLFPEYTLFLLRTSWNDVATLIQKNVYIEWNFSPKKHFHFSSQKKAKSVLYSSCFVRFRFPFVLFFSSNLSFFSTYFFVSFYFSFLLSSLSFNDIFHLNVIELNFAFSELNGKTSTSPRCM